MKKWFLIIFVSLTLTGIAQNTLRRDLWRQDHDTSISRLPYVRIGTLLLPTGITGGTAWTVDGDTIYNTDSTKVKLTNWLQTDYITTDSITDFTGTNHARNTTNNFIGFEAAIKDLRAFDSIGFSDFMGFKAGRDSDTIFDSQFIGSWAGSTASQVLWTPAIGMKAIMASREVINTSVLGSLAGALSDSIYFSNYIGAFAGFSTARIDKSTFIGSDNLFGGAGTSSSDVSESVYLGNAAGYSSAHIEQSTLIGAEAGYNSSYLDNAIFIGTYAGYDADTIFSSIFIGDSAGYNQNNIAYQLWIDNSATATPLIWGDFDADSLVINGDLTATGDMVLDGDLEITGGITGNININNLDPTPSDSTVSGTTVTMTAGEGMVWGMLCYIKSDGKLWKADADASTTMPGVYLVAQDTILANATGLFLQDGYIQDAAGWNWTVGDLIYAGTNTGRLLGSASKPSGSGDQVQIIGVAIDANTLKFTPNLMLIEIE